MRKDSFSESEKILLKSIFSDNTKEFIISEFNKFGFHHSWQSLRLNAKKLNLVRNPEIIKKEMIEGGKTSKKFIEDVWTDQEDSILKKYYPNNLQSEIEKKLPGRTFRSIRGRALSLGLSRNKEVIDQDRAIHLKENYGVDSNWQLEYVKKKSRQTNIEKRGVEYPTQCPEVKQKIKQTVQEKYGVDNVFQSNEIKEKIIETNLKNLGVENPQQSPIIKEKTKNTNLNRYGIENPFQLVDRVQAGMVKKYGVTSPLQNADIKAQQQTTNIERYGVPSPAQNELIQKKIEETNLIKYGTKSPFGNDGIKQKIIDTNMGKYGVPNPLKLEIIQNKAKEALYKYGTQKCSKQQFYIAQLLKGKINFPVGNCNVDILLDNKIICEYDGGGHNLGVKIGCTTVEESVNNERKRDIFLKSKGFKIIRIISNEDLIPTDPILQKMILEGKNYLNKGHSWITYDIDKKLVNSSQFNLNYDFGKLRKIS
jgi:very-short-patch-repair endonuclease